jgi:hypothetical protein
MICHLYMCQISFLTEKEYSIEFCANKNSIWFKYISFIENIFLCVLLEICATYILLYLLYFKMGWKNVELLMSIYHIEMLTPNAWLDPSPVVSHFLPSCRAYHGVCATNLGVNAKYGHCVHMQCKDHTVKHNASKDWKIWAHALRQRKSLMVLGIPYHFWHQTSIW